MGAAFQTMEVDGQTTREAVKTLFAEAQERDRYENGHSYSGGFGMASGLTFRNDKTFNSKHDASEWLAENAQKWEDALVVTFHEHGRTHWLIGAWCAE